MLWAIAVNCTRCCGRRSEKIQRIRGAGISDSSDAPAGSAAGKRQRTRGAVALLITTCVLAGLTVIAFGGFEIVLGSGVPQVQNTSLNAR